MNDFQVHSWRPRFQGATTGLVSCSVSLADLTSVFTPPSAHESSIGRGPHFCETRAAGPRKEQTVPVKVVIEILEWVECLILANSKEQSREGPVVPGTRPRVNMTTSDSRTGARKSALQVCDFGVVVLRLMRDREAFS